MLRLKNIDILPCRAELGKLPQGKLLINTINAHSYNVAQEDEEFAEALLKGDVLIPDGASIVKACRWIKAKSQPKERIAGWDLFAYEMEALNERCATNRSETNESPEGLRKDTGVNANEGEGADGNEGASENSNGLRNENENKNEAFAAKRKVMFMGSSEKVLGLIKERAKTDYPSLEIVTYSPPYKPEFSEEDNKAIIDAINVAKPDLLWIGMTAPKQEKWTYKHWKELDIDCHVGTIGAVFDFYAGTVKRAPLWWQEHGLEWLYRLLKEPRRMWRRYIIGNAKFLWNMRNE